MESFDIPIVANFPTNYPWYKKWWSNITYWVGQIPWFPRHNSLSRSDIRRIKSLIRAWDVILVWNFQHASALFIAWVVTHAIAYLWKWRCIHAFAHGVSYISLRKIVRTYDSVILLRPRRNDFYRKYFLWLIDKIGKPYDFFFWIDDTNEEKFFCTKLINDVMTASGYNTWLQSIRFPDNVVDTLLDTTFCAHRVLTPEQMIGGNFSVVFHSENISYSKGVCLLQKSKKKE
jgi:hypothetical protein